MSSQTTVFRFVLENDVIQDRSVIRHILSLCGEHGINEDTQFRIHLGLEETISNAVIHGNLEIESATYRTHENFSNWEKEVRKRMQQPPYCSRKVAVEVEVIPEEQVVISVEDEGNGFEHQRVLNKLPDDIYQPHGRGLSIVSNVSQLLFNHKGNRVTMTFTCQEDE